MVEPVPMALLLLLLLLLLVAPPTSPWLPPALRGSVFRPAPAFEAGTSLMRFMEALLQSVVETLAAAVDDGEEEEEEEGEDCVSGFDVAPFAGSLEEEEEDGEEEEGTMPGDLETTPPVATAPDVAAWAPPLRVELAVEEALGVAPRD